MSELSELEKYYSGKKFNRSFNLSIEDSDNSFVVVPSKFTVEFTITRNNLSSTNTANFVIYNLGGDNRSRIYKDIWDMATDRAIQFYAGYASSPADLLPRCFNGKIRRAFSHRQRTDWRTEIEAFDGTMPTDEVKINLPAGTTKRASIEQVGQEMEGLNKKVTVGQKFTDMAKRGISLIGNPMKLLTEITGNQAYVDDQAVYALDTTEVVLGDLRLIDGSVGILGTPRRGEAYVEIDMLFEPRLKPSQLIELKSTQEPRHNGVYKVTGFTHRGVISMSQSGECRTSVTLQKLDGYSVIYDANTLEYRVALNG